MKKYSRIQKKYIPLLEFEEEQKIQKRKAQICKGGKPHDFQLVLPPNVTYDEKYNFEPEVYYNTLQEIYEFKEEKRAELADLGIILKYFSMCDYFDFRHYTCSGCGKRKIDHSVSQN